MFLKSALLAGLCWVQSLLLDEFSRFWLVTHKKSPNLKRCLKRLLHPLGEVGEIDSTTQLVHHRTSERWGRFGWLDPEPSVVIQLSPSMPVNHIVNHVNLHIYIYIRGGYHIYIYNYGSYPQLMHINAS